MSTTTHSPGGSRQHNVPNPQALGPTLKEVALLFLGTCLFSYIMAITHPWEDNLYCIATLVAGFGFMFCAIYIAVTSILESVIVQYALNRTMAALAETIERVPVYIGNILNRLVVLARRFVAASKRMPAYIDDIIAYTKDLNELQKIKEGSKKWLKQQLRGPVEKVMEWVDVNRKLKEPIPAYPPVPQYITELYELFMERHSRALVASNMPIETFLTLICALGMLLKGPYQLRTTMLDVYVVLYSRLPPGGDGDCEKMLTQYVQSFNFKLYEYIRAGGMMGSVLETHAMVQELASSIKQKCPGLIELTQANVDTAMKHIAAGRGVSKSVIPGKVGKGEDLHQTTVTEDDLPEEFELI
ncbi:uncharacterized protein AB675_1678 [Cyphellophora attinorum]|uniref:Uncharacterized protein n=1 Tax=Cyphellophora attinorum TaxID=1664694 RepID=A0A0N0NIQ1_9EURO|nr:uncharacterized protein AB675_1678 [Phialophora attinorum]KPI36081.1 hypothetical protein AB675_1678 [Phialophora attinorum]